MPQNHDALTAALARLVPGTPLPGDDEFNVSPWRCDIPRQRGSHPCVPLFSLSRSTRLPSFRSLSSLSPHPKASPSSSAAASAATRLAARLAWAPGAWGPAAEPPLSLTVDTAWPAPPLCCGAGPPPVALVPTLPLGDDGVTFHAPSPAPWWRVVDLDPGACSPSDAALATALRSHRAPAPLSGAASGRPGARGGGGAAAAAAAREAATASAAAAAAAARTGAWLREYEGGGLPPRAPMPGGGAGLFGAWAGKGGEGAPPPNTPPPPPPPPAHPPATDLLFGGGWADGVKACGGGARGGSSSAYTSTSTSDGEEEEEAEASRAAASTPAPPSDPVTAATDAALAAHPPRPPPPPPPPPAATNPYARWARRAPAAQLAARFAALAASGGLAMAFPHRLDPFQQEAIALLEGGSSVFVAAHTGAGKTAVAEYAAALAARNGCRCFYTAPIKTISNQKFRDFTAKGFDTGLVTGDVSIKPDASTVIMTTEVLRSMLYRGDDGLADVECVVFDEVHYLNDAERGVVWEEVLILLPRTVRVVLLSATVPNVEEFAGWVGRTRRCVVWVTGTQKRPVPLEHALWFRGELHTFGAKDAFVADGYAAARAAWKKASGVGVGGPATKKEEKRALPTGRGGGGGGGGGGRGGPQPARGRGPSSASTALTLAMGAHGPPSAPRTDAQQWRTLLVGLVARGLLPAVVFLFSKKKIDALADALASGSLDLGASPGDAGFCSAFLDRSLARLPLSDRTLPQVGRLRRLLRAGLGIHHSGLLPLLKEVVEMLFCLGKIRLLICAETFAMGFNGPARAVIFGSLRKHDGREFRSLLPGEYTQMAGRAGRRGIDKVGSVILPAWVGGEGARPAPGAPLPPLPAEVSLRHLLTGRGAPLASQFRLTYGMILGLARRGDGALGVEGMARASFAEFHSARAGPGAVRAAAATDAEASTLESAPWDPAWPARDGVAAYAAACGACDGAAATLEAAVARGDGAGLAPACSPGRVVFLRATRDSPVTVGVVLGSRVSGSSREAVVAALDWFGEGAAVLAAAGAPAAAASAAGAASPALPPMGLRLLSQKRDGDGDLSELGSRAASASLGAHATTPLSLPIAGTAGGVPFLLLALPPLALDGLAPTRLGGVDGPAALAAAVAAPPGPAFTASLLALARAAEAIPPSLLDPLADLRFSGLDAVGPARARAAALTLLLNLPCAGPAGGGPGLAAALGRVRAAEAARATSASLRASLAAAALAAAPDFAARTRLLVDLGYLDAADRTITVKGRAACEVAAGDTLAVAESLFAGAFAGLGAADAAALLSGFVFQEKVPTLREWPTHALACAVARVRDVLATAGAAQAGAGVPGLMESDPPAWADAVFRPGLAPAVHAWASGAPFAEVCTLTEVAEGTIVRAVTRVDEAAREIRDAARAIGDTALWKAMDGVSTAIRRDIVFAASLYVG